MSNAPHFAMPVGLPADPANAPTQFLALRPRLESEVSAANTVSVWVANEAVYSGLHAMVRGLLSFVPAGGADPLGRAVTEPTILIRIWAKEYMVLRQLTGRASPKFILYRNLDVSEVRGALQAVISSHPRLSSQLGVVLPKVMSGQSRLLVNAGTMIGRAAVDTAATAPTRAGRRRLDLSFQDEIGDSMDVREALDLWSLTSEQLVVGHPILDGSPSCHPSVAPVEGRTCIRLPMAQPLVSGTVQVSIDGTATSDLFVSADRQSVFFRAPSHAAGYVDITVQDSTGGLTTYTRALRYVEDFDTAFHAIATSFSVGLDCVEDVLSSPQVTFEVMVQLDELADLKGRVWRELLANRSAATGHIPWDPDIELFAEIIASRNDAQARRVKALLRMPATPPSTAGITERVFGGVNFFTDIRPQMDANRGLFIGKESGAVVYACADATFYRFRVLDRSPSKSMSEAILDLMSSDHRVRVAANGQNFGEGKTDYIYHRPSAGSPGRTFPVGQYFVDGALREEHPWSRHSFGQIHGRGEAAIVVSSEQPGAVTTPGRYRDAMSAEVLIAFGISRAWAAADMSVATRMVYGVHRQTNTLFFLATEMTRFASIISRLEEMGVTDAVNMDGGTSVLLVADGVIKMDETRFMPPKDWSIPLAGYLQLDSFEVDGSGAVSPLSTDPRWPHQTTVHGLSGVLRLSSSGGTELSISNFGSGQVRGASVDVATGLSVTLVASSSLLTTQRLFTDRAGSSSVTALLTYQSNSNHDGYLNGTLSIPTARGTLVVNVNLLLIAVP